MKMILNNNVEFLVDSIIHMGNSFEINFKEGVSYLDVQPIYDPVSPIFDKKALRKITLVNEESGEIQGVHLGYTEVSNISCFKNQVKVLVERENEVATDLELTKEDVISTIGINQQQDTLIVETELRLMDIEMTLEELTQSKGIALSSLSLVRSTSGDLLMRMVIEGNYASKESMMNTIQKYYDRGRITEEEYNNLIQALYPEESNIATLPIEEPTKKRTRKKSN